MKTLFITISLFLSLSLTAQVKKHLTHQQSNKAFEDIVSNAALERSRQYVRQRLQFPKNIKFSDVFQSGLVPEDSTICISSYYTITGIHKEKIGQYYYCWLKLWDIKKEIWELQKLDISSFPFTTPLQ